MRRIARPPRSAGIAAAVLGVAIATALIFGLREIAPVLALGVVYVLVALLVSTYWGLALGIAQPSRPSPCSSAPLIAASTALRRCRARASGEPKRLPPPRPVLSGP
ncbi:MAG: hypothetical protein JWQ20_1604 [Conexibacter sp.]|nr:hypothetical protein [Conexibacter sp.]